MLNSWANSCRENPVSGQDKTHPLKTRYCLACLIGEMETIAVAQHLKCLQLTIATPTQQSAIRGKFDNFLLT